MARRANPKTGYRVDYWLAGPGCWAEYTSRRELVDLEFAQSLLEHLPRNRTRARIVEIQGKAERIIAEWQPAPRISS